MQRTLSLSIPFDYLTDEYFKNCRKNGFGAFELSVAYDKYDCLDLPKIAKIARDNGLDTRSFHLPFQPFDTLNIAGLSRELRGNSVRYLSEWLKKAADADFRYAVIHPSGEPIAEENREESMLGAMDSLSVLADICDRAGIVLAVENLPRTCLGNCSDEIMRLISVSPSLRVCFDTNHLLIQDQLSFMDAVKEKLVTVHVSDYDFANERHWLPGEGKTDWVSIMDKFDEIGYAGAFTYELGFVSRTIMREHPLTPAEIKQNFDELNERNPLTMRGTHYKKLGKWDPIE